jgi:glycosyltransferase involved in cell wall biosynthesis
MGLKIGIIAHVRHDIREPFAGGLEAHTAQLAEGFAGNGHRVTVFAAGGDCGGKVERFCEATESLFAMAGESFAYEHAAYAKLMDGLRCSDFDVIHNNSLHYLPITMAHLLPMPMVTTLHTPPFWELAGSIRLGGPCNRFFVAVSRAVTDAWSAITRIDKMIYNGVDLRKFAFAALPGAEPYFVWSGRIVPEKGLHFAIAAARLVGIPLVFAGPIADRGYFDAEILPRMTNTIRYAGHLDHGDLIALIGAARVCLCTPDWEEPYGLVVAEALACGTPVAGFARGALPSLLDAASGILVKPGDVQALAGAALRAQHLSRWDCRRRAEQIGDARNMIRGYEDFYAGVIGQTRSAPANDAARFITPADRPALMAHYLESLPPNFVDAA